MEKLLKKFKLSTRLLTITLTWWVLTILLFGDFSNQSNFWILLISTIMLRFLINFRYKSDNNKLFGPRLPYLLTAGFFLGFFHLNPFLVSVRDPIIELTINSSFGIIGWWINQAAFIPCALLYRETKKKEYYAQFENDEVSMNREDKINKIIGNWKF